MGRSAASAWLEIRANRTALPDRASASAQPTGPPPTTATSISGRSTASNERLDIANRLRRGGRQYLAPFEGHRHVVLDAHADAPERLGDIVGRAHVAARLHRQRHPGLEAAPFAARLVFP